MFAILGSGLLFIGIVIWTVIVNKAKSINDARVSADAIQILTGVSNFGAQVTTSAESTPLGITVSSGASLWLFWASFVCLFLSIMPYLVRYVVSHHVKSTQSPDHAKAAVRIADKMLLVNINKLET